MNGIQLTREFLDFCHQTEVDSTYASQRLIYKHLDMAGGIYVRDTRCLHSSFPINTIAGQQNYPLPPDFIDLYMQGVRNRSFIRYSDGTTIANPVLADYERLYQENLTDNQDFPPYFAIIDAPTQSELITGTTTDAGAESLGRCILTDSTKNFLTTDLVYPRDSIYNTTDGSLGIVLSIIDATHLYCTLFDGTDNDISNADAYIIQSASQKTLVLAAPSLTDDHIITVPYVCMPPPIYWAMAAWPFPEYTCRAIASGAVSLFKLTEMEYKEAQSLGSLFDAEVKQYKTELGRKKLQQGPSRRRERM
jgi:hypothetical protein